MSMRPRVCPARGILLVAVGWLGIWLEQFNGFRIVAMMLDFYLSVFGFVLAALEAARGGFPGGL
jgi:hypothetical protein